jgi:hypothetical protein
LRGIPKGHIILAGCFCLAIAGCGGSGNAASPPSKTATSKSHSKAATPKPRPTSATPELASYAQFALPVIRSGITQVTTLMQQMQSTATSQMGKVCATSGGDLASNREAYTSIQPPVPAKPLYGRAKHGYSITLGATDECGIAGDSNSSSAMAAAAKDLQRGLGELTTTRNTLTGWAAKH